MTKKVLTAMSGGVDSTVTAALLLRQGYEVSGVTLRLFDGSTLGIGPGGCCSLSDMEDARAAAQRLGFPYYVFDFTQPFRKEVIDRFVAGYTQGQTPNPCLDCNRYVKFSTLLDRAIEMGYDAIATGHYARIEQNADTGRWELKKAADPLKDQSYVLYTLSQEELEHLLLPLGGLRKPQVRAIAEELSLGNAHKPDSQDICFVPDGDYAAFLERQGGFKSQPGNFVDIQGNILGRHKGIVHYTVGQRRGLGVSAAERLYVVEVRAACNEVVLGSEEQLHTDSFWVGDCNWVSIATLQQERVVQVRTRYHQRESEAVLRPVGNLVQVTYKEPQRAPAPGQAAVFYDGDTVVGGGVVQPCEAQPR